MVCLLGYICLSVCFVLCLRGTLRFLGFPFLSMLLFSSFLMIIVQAGEMEQDHKNSFKISFLRVYKQRWIFGSSPMYHYTREEKKISGRVKLHIGDMQGKVNQDDSVSTIKCDDLSPLKYLCVDPCYHTSISLVQFQHSNVMTFLHLDIYVWVTSTTLLYPWLSFNIQAWWPFCT